MKFFFPDSQDQIDPGFDFRTEERSPFRVRQRDDRYAHEALRKPPFDGLLVSKTIVDGTSQGSGKYTLAQRQRLYRVGVRRFFRVDEAPGPRLSTMGDCGAFSYVKEEEPPYTCDEVIDFYEDCGFELGLSVDHVILGYDATTDADESAVPPVWAERQALTLELARQFLKRHRARKAKFDPVGVAQGWSPASYARAVKELQKMGYQRIALGGMVPLTTDEILASLKAAAAVRRKRTQFHLLGITRCEHVSTFAGFGATSFDSTSPFRQSFKDEDDNYYTTTRNYTAIRVPQVDANPKLRARIQAGRVDQEKALELERTCMRRLREFDRDRIKLTTVLDGLRRYEDLYDGDQDHSDAYREILEERPWKRCRCGICKEVGIEVAVFRGSERNKRRGFHNLFVFSQRLQRELSEGK